MEIEGTPRRAPELVALLVANFLFIAPVIIFIFDIAASSFKDADGQSVLGGLFLISFLSFCTIILFIIDGVILYRDPYMRFRWLMVSSFFVTDLFVFLMLLFAESKGNHIANGTIFTIATIGFVLFSLLSFILIVACACGKRRKTVQKYRTF